MDKSKLLLRALAGEKLTRPPLWLMRQAGRYLPEYRATRAQAGSFLDLCYDSELATEVTLQPIRRYGFDAAILFADILLLPHALGQELWFSAGEGPRLAPITSRDELRRLNLEAIHERLAPVYQTVRNLRARLPAETALIGFAGAPWTVATYMVAGRGKEEQAAARNWAYRDPAGFAALIEIITQGTIAYLMRQVEAGAEVVKIFDSWAGALSTTGFRQWSIEPTRQIVAALKGRFPTLPIIGFPRGAGANLIDYARETGVDAVALDTAQPIHWVRDVVQPQKVVQGNLDPILLVVGGEALKRETAQLLETLGPSRFIFNLGHGITPDADPRHVEALVRQVKG